MGEGEEGFVMGFWPSKSLGPRPCRILFKVNIYMPRTQATLADNWRESWRGKMGEECEGGCGGRRQEGGGEGVRQRQTSTATATNSCHLQLLFEACESINNNNNDNNESRAAQNDNKDVERSQCRGVEYRRGQGG